MSDDVLQQQIDYYRARAGEYDEWFYRLNRYDYGEALNQQWFDEAQQAQAALRALGRFERILELAAGTGIWTVELSQMADHVTAIDISEEVLEINHAKAKVAHVHYHQSDLFEWQPAQQYDLVFFGFWLSHVPPERVAEFMAKVYRAVKAGGHVFLIDSLADTNSTATDQSVATTADAKQKRKLNDGREFQIIKVYYRPETLLPLLQSAGFQAETYATERYFIYAHGIKPQLS
jgi:demethylmenaquinone methyltransferase/2-methoxy-6-polyprenyl-1,4-benzoquinol methylase